MGIERYLHVGTENGMMGLEEPLTHYEPRHLPFGDRALVTQVIESLHGSRTYVPGFFVDRMRLENGYWYFCDPVSPDAKDEVTAFLRSQGVDSVKW